jgi:hypothetical protein
MLTLAGKTTVWPHPEEIFMNGAKLQCQEILKIASLSMGLSTPMYLVADEGVLSKDFLKEVKEGLFNGVLKRDYSMMSDKVIIVNAGDVLPLESLENFQSALETQRKNWRSVEGFFPSPGWLIQPFLAHLRYIGEVRLMIVGGRIVYKVTTTPSPGKPGCWEVIDEPLIRPIHLHR